MKTCIRLFFVLMTVLICLSTANAAGETGSGREAIGRACAAAAANRTLVLVKFGAEWCPWCRDMDKIFREPVMVEALNTFEFVDLDVGKRSIVDGKKRYERHYDLMMQYARKAFIPQLFILDKKGRLVARLNPVDYERTSGPEGNDPEKLARVLSRYRLP